MRFPFTEHRAHSTGSIEDFTRVADRAWKTILFLGIIIGTCFTSGIDSSDHKIASDFSGGVHGEGLCIERGGRFQTGVAQGEAVPFLGLVQRYRDQQV